MPRIGAQELRDKWMKAFKDGDPAPIMDIVADDIRFNDPLTGQELRGKQEYRENMETFIGAFTLESMDLENVVEKDRDLVARIRMRGRHTGDLIMPTGERLSATNRTVDVEFADFATFDDQGRMVSDWTIMDTASFMRQLGLIEERPPTP